MTKICEFCGKSYRKRLLPEAYLGNNCFDCSFWLGKMNYPIDIASQQVIINGEHYMTYPATNELIRGCGGQWFKIQFFDGRIIETNDLWCQGSIPNRFKQILQDNAVFVSVKTQPHQEVNMFDWLDWLDNEIDIEDWMVIGPVAEELAEEEKERRRLEDSLDEGGDDEW